MKNLSGLLFVIGICLFYALVLTLLVVTVLGFYGMMFFTLAWVMAKSYLVLGNTWFFIVWPVLLVALIIFKTRKYWMKWFK